MLKAFDIIKVVANSKWDADKFTLRHLYRSLVRSKLDFGCLYGSVRTSYLKALDAKNHQSRPSAMAVSFSDFSCRQFEC